MTQRLYRPRPATVRLGSDGTPAALGRVAVEAVREQWLVEDRWWTARPIRRCYFELTSLDGRDVVVFRDLVSGRWFSQRGA
jgi:hypothetical protein